MRSLIVVNGGDAPGINTFIARYSVLAAQHGDSVYGADAGFAGVLNGDIAPVDRRVARRLDGIGGTVLASTREAALAADDAQAKLTHVINEFEIDNIVMFGGNGSLTHIPPLLKAWNVPHIGIPTTIDNDVVGTEETLGFDSACNYAYQAIDGVIATAHALPGRIFMVETLGGDTGYIALAVAYGAGAHVALVPEYDFEDAWLGERIKDAIARERHALVVLSEGVKQIPQFAEMIPRLTGVRLRYTRLGHAQRGGHVTHRDRVLAQAMARTAYFALKDGTQTGITTVRGGQVALADYNLADLELPPPNRTLYDIINGLT